MNRRIVALAALVFAARANAQQLTTTEDVNLRKAPTKASAVVDVLAGGTEVTLLGKRSHYDSVKTADEKVGWVYDHYVKASGGVAALVAPTTAAAKAIHVAAGSYHSCAVTGDVSPNGSNPTALKALNKLKNRSTVPKASEMDANITLAHLLAPGADDNRFDTASGGVIEGVVVDAKVGGNETVNCHATDPQYRDTHIEVATHSGAAAKERVIVEVTPRWRAAMSGSDDWSTAGLKSLCGHKVRFTGWAFYDTEHRGNAENTAPGVASNWRATVWELHPVTKIEVLDNTSKPCLTH